MLVSKRTGVVSDRPWLISAVDGSDYVATDAAMAAGRTLLAYNQCHLA